MRWHTLATQLARRLDDTPPKRREAALVEFALESGLSPYTVRSYLVATRFLERLARHDADLALALSNAPAVAVLTISRWHAHDSRGALEAARVLAEGGHTIRSIALAERAARSGVPMTQKGQWLKRWVGRKCEYQLGHGKVILGGTLSEPSLNERKLLKLDLIAGEDATKIACIIAGPYANPQQYTDRVVDLMLKLFGLATFVERVALILPSNCDPQIFLDWRICVSCEFRVTEFVHIVHEFENQLVLIT